jgi:hypothetical protein
MNEDGGQTALKYEIEMMRRTWRQLGEIGTTVTDWGVWVTRNALLGSFLVHARVLIHFLHDTDRGRDNVDILAQDFCDPAQPRDAGPVSDEVSDLLNRISKETEHLTTRRTDIPEAKQWSEQLLKIVAADLRKFRRHARSDLLGKVEPLLASMNVIQPGSFSNSPSSGYESLTFDYRSTDTRST